MFIRSKRGRKTPNDIPETSSDSFGSQHRKFFAKHRAALRAYQTSRSTEGPWFKHCPYASETAYSVVGTVVWINGGLAQGNPAATLPKANS
jgi:hypothetical protein